MSNRFISGAVLTGIQMYRGVTVSVWRRDGDFRIVGSGVIEARRRGGGIVA